MNKNMAKMILGKVENGIIENDEMCVEYGGDSWTRVKGMENIYYEPHSKGVILRPNLEPVDMDGKYRDTGMTDYRGSWWKAQGNPGSFENIKVQGSKGKRVEYHKFVEIKNEEKNKIEPAYWRIDTDYVLKENQGVVIWFNKYLLPHRWSNCIVISIENKDSTIGTRLTIGRLQEQERWKDIIPINKNEQEITLEHWYQAKKEGRWPKKVADVEIQRQVFQIPQHTDLYHWAGDWKVLAIFVIGQWIVVGLNGLENTIAMKVRDYGLVKDKYKQEMPLIIDNKSKLVIWGYGAILFGWKGMEYEGEGNIEIPVIKTGKKIEKPGIDCTSYYVPEDTEIEMRGFAENWNSQEDATVSGIITLKGERKSNKKLLEMTEEMEELLPENEKEKREKIKHEQSVTDVTPVLFRAKIYDTIRRGTASYSPFVISTDIIRLESNVSVDKNWFYLGREIMAQLTCYENNHQYLYEQLSSEVDFQIKPLKQNNWIRIGKQLIDTVTMEIEQINEQKIKIETKDRMKDLEETSLGSSQSFDDKGWTDVDLMKYLIEDKAGIKLKVDKDTEYKLTKGVKEKKPNWKYEASAKLMDVIRDVLEFSTDVIYIDRDGNVVYRERPKATDTVKWTINAQTHIIGRPKYTRKDDRYTHIKVIGQAGENTQEYKQGDFLVGIGYNKQVAKEIGRTRILPAVKKMQYGDWESVQRAIEWLWDLYVVPGQVVEFEIRNFEDYMDMEVFDIIDYSDNIFNKVNGLYAITSIKMEIGMFAIKGIVTARKVS